MPTDLTPLAPALLGVPADLAEDMRKAVVMRERAEHAIEEHGADDSWALAYQAHADAALREVLVRAGHHGRRATLPWLAGRRAS
ncbi:MAG: hypothetical protein IMW98_08535 [Firmicutes bacterium]|nr:hypothetical protein [Bacillota bacterium]MBE3590852.1 hypothetical protein [Bacillota bacterium]